MTARQLTLDVLSDDTHAAFRRVLANLAPEASLTPQIQQAIHRRFDALLSKVEITDDGCWVANRFNNYPAVYLTTTLRAAGHRLSFLIFIGDIPDGQVVRHSCDNRSCVNPEHLETGTQAQNVRDCIERRRAKYNPARGEASGRARLTEELVVQIRNRVRGGERVWDIADELETSYTTVWAAATGRSWTHLECPPAPTRPQRAGGTRCPIDLAAAKPEAERLWRAGISGREIREQTGVSLPFLTKWGREWRQSA